MYTFLSFISLRIFVIPNIRCTNAIPIKNAVSQATKALQDEKKENWAS